MGALIPNIAKGRFVEKATLPLANDALVWMILQSAGLSSDAVLRDDDSFADVLTHGTEATFAGYARQNATGVTVTVDDTNDWVQVDVADPTWNPTAAQALGKVVLGYDDDTTSGTNANIVPQFMDDFGITTPVSGSVSYQVAAGGFGKAA